MADVFAPLRSEIARIPVAAALGRVVAVRGGTVQVSGLTRLACQGDHVQIGALGGEVLGLAPEGVTVLTDGAPDGLAIGAGVELCGATGIAPDDSWIGRIVDPFGRPLDGRPLQRGPLLRPLRAEAPAAAGWARVCQPGLRSLTRSCRWCGGRGSGFSRGRAWENPRSLRNSPAGSRRMWW